MLEQRSMSPLMAKPKNSVSSIRWFVSYTYLKRRKQTLELRSKDFGWDHFGGGQ